MTQPRIVVGAQKRPLPTLLIVFLSALVGALSSVLFVRLGAENPLSGDPNALARDLKAAQQQLERQQQDISTLTRGQQIVDAANVELRKEVLTLEEQTADLRSEISFYQRLLESGSEQRGLVVHALDLTATSDPRLFFYRLTLSQNLQQVKETKGRFVVSVTGVRNGEIVRLSGESLGAGDGDYAFKFFQQIRGELSFPEGFQPERLEVALDPEQRNARNITRDFQWSDLIGTS